MQINLCHHAKTKSFKADFAVASGNDLAEVFFPAVESKKYRFCEVVATIWQQNFIIHK